MQKSQTQMKLTIMLVSIMFAILFLSTLLIFITVNKALKPLKDLTIIAEQLSIGTVGKIDEKIVVNRKDEIGKLGMAIDKLRISIVLAMRRIKREKD